MSLSKDQLLAASRKRREVIIPELGTVTLQSPSAGEWLDYSRWVAALEKDSLEHVTRVVALTAIDDDGKPLLTDQDCRELPHQILLLLSRAARELMTTETDVENAKGESEPSR